MSTAAAPRIGSLFTGAAGLDMAVVDVLGGDVVWQCEIEPAACRVLAHRFPATPNLGDVSTVDWAAVPPVDVLTGGFPCQDVSMAGSRRGLRDGTRSGLWAHFAAAVDELRPGLVVIENVRGLTSACADSEMGQCPRCVGDGPVHRPFLRALGRVLGDLADIGYDARWTGIRASDVGAPHERFRVFVVAEPVQHADSGIGGASGADQDQAASAVVPVRRSDPFDADTAHVGHERGGDPRAGRHGFADGGVSAADAERRGRDGRSRDTLGGPVDGTAAAGDSPINWGKYRRAVERWEAVTRPAPAPATIGAKGGWQLSGAFDEWVMGWPEGWVTDVPGISNNDALRLCGNGVVPQQAVEALRRLLPIASEAAA